MSDPDRLEQIAKQMADAGVPVAAVEITKEDAAFALALEVARLRDRLMACDRLICCLTHLAGGEATISADTFAAVQDKELNVDADTPEALFVMRLVDAEPPPAKH